MGVFYQFFHEIQGKLKQIVKPLKDRFFKNTNIYIFDGSGHTKYEKNLKWLSYFVLLALKHHTLKYVSQYVKATVARGAEP